jgi:hypothetical protein
MATSDQPSPLRDGPWTGMVDAIAPTVTSEGKYVLGQNVYPLDPAIGEGVVGRPGVRVLGAIGGAPGARRAQGHYQFTKRDGTEYTIRIVGGKFETFNWATEVWTEVVTTAQLTTAGITLDATAPIAFLTFEDKVIISDETNTAWMWDGTTGAGLTKLTNAPVFYGPLTNYSGRVWGIKKTERGTMVWSEAGDATTGYEAGGYNNAWTIAQTDPNRLTRLIGTNEALYVLRGRSGTTVSGQVTSTFSSAATRESLSDTIGTMSPFAVVVQDLNIIVLDADLHPQLLRPGATGFTELWTAFRETLKRIPKTEDDQRRCISVLYTPASLLLFAIPDRDATDPNLLLVYDIKGVVPVPVAIWRGWEITSMAMVKNAEGTPYLVHGDSEGYTYLHGNPEDAEGPWDDELVSGTVPIDHIVETRPLGFSPSGEKIFDRIDVSIRANTQMTLEISQITPRGTSEAQEILVESGFQGWDQAVWDDMIWDVDDVLGTLESHGDVGIDEQARWLKVRIRHRTLGEQFGLVALEVVGYLTDNDPEIP